MIGWHHYTCQMFGIHLSAYSSFEGSGSSRKNVAVASGAKETATKKRTKEDSLFLCAKKVLERDEIMFFGFLIG